MRSAGSTRVALITGFDISISGCSVRFRISKEPTPSHATLVSVFSGSSSCKSCSYTESESSDSGSSSSGLFDVKLTRFVCGLRGTGGFCLAGGGGGGWSGRCKGEGSATGVGGGVGVGAEPDIVLSLERCCEYAASGNSGAACELDS